MKMLFYEDHLRRMSSRDWRFGGQSAGNSHRESSTLVYIRSIKVLADYFLQLLYSGRSKLFVLLFFDQPE